MPLRVTGETQISSLHINARSFREAAGDNRFYIESEPGKFVSIDVDGDTHKSFDLASIPITIVKSPHDLHLVDISAGSHGSILATVWWAESPTSLRTGLVRFDSDGDYDKLIWLDTDLTVTHAVEFGTSGNFVVTGYTDKYQTKLALFDSRGFLLKDQLSPYADKGDPVPNGAGDPAAQDEFKNHVMWETGVMQLARASDDSVYVYNPGWDHKILRIQPNGKMDQINLGGKERNAVPMHMVVSTGYIYLSEAILDEGQKPDAAMAMKNFSVSVYDRYQGTLDESYTVKDALGFVFLPVSTRLFYFPKLTVPPGGAVNVSLIREEP